MRERCLLFFEPQPNEVGVRDPSVHLFFFLTSLRLSLHFSFQTAAGSSVDISATQVQLFCFLTELFMFSGSRINGICSLGNKTLFLLLVEQISFVNIVYPFSLFLSFTSLVSFLPNFSCKLSTPASVLVAENKCI